MEAFTDIPQSKQLMEILPIESADMCYGINDDTLKYDNLPWLIPYHKYTAKEFYVPCWSLSALLAQMPCVELVSSNDNHYRAFWHEMYSEWHTNPVDACVELLLRVRKEEENEST